VTREEYLREIGGTTHSTTEPLILAYKSNNNNIVVMAQIAYMPTVIII